MNAFRLFSGVVCVAASLPSAAAVAKPRSYELPEETATLRPGPNLGVAQDYCAACHSVDYISTQPPGRGEAFWKAEVGKMIHSYGAPIDEADARAIVEYLSKTY